MSKLEDYLAKQKVDKRRILAASKHLEALRPEDRKVILAKRNRKGDDAKAAPDAGGDKKKRRSGKAVTRPTLDAALKGDAIAGPAKTRILRAVNHVLGQKKKTAALLKDLF